MPYATAIKTSAVATPPVGVTLATVRKDKGISEDTVFTIDLGNEISWPSQASPGASDVLEDLSGTLTSVPDTAKRATFTGTPRPTFANGGLLFPTGGDGRVVLPAIAKPAATSRGFAAMCWMALRNDSASIRRGFGWYRTGGGSAQSYGFYYNNTARQIVTFYDGVSSTITLPANAFNANGWGLFLLCFGRCEDGLGGFLAKQRIYVATPGSASLGLNNNSASAAGATAKQPAETSPTIGYSDDLGANIPQLFYRFALADVGTAAGKATSAWFDARCDQEYAAHAARADFALP